MGPGDISYPMHIEKGLGRYLQSAMAQQPDYSTLNQSFTTLANQGPMVRGGQFIDPTEEQQYATSGYMGARGQIAGNYLNNMFQLAALDAMAGNRLGTMAAMIPTLQASALQSQGAGGSSILGMFG